MLFYLALHRIRLSEHSGSHRNLVVSYTTISPFPRTYGVVCFCGAISPLPGLPVKKYPTLWCSDFPPSTYFGRLFFDFQSRCWTDILSSLTDYSDLCFNWFCNQNSSTTLTINQSVFIVNLDYQLWSYIKSATTASIIFIKNNCVSIFIFN